MKFKYQRGSQIVEFAFVLPFFILILFLVIDFGFLVYNKAVITNASREAARAGTVLSGSWSAAAVKAVACAYARTSLISTKSGGHATDCTGPADPVISVSNPNGNVPPHFGDPVTVQVTYAYSGFLLNKTNAWLTSTTFPALTAASTMSHE